MALKFRRGTTAQKSGSLAFGEPFVNTDLNTLQIGGPNGDITLGTTGESSAFAGVSVSASSFISGSGLKITGNAAIDGNLTLGGAITIGDATADTVNVIASLSSSLIPSNDGAFDVGKTDKRYKTIYANNLELASGSGLQISLFNTGANTDYHIRNNNAGNFTIFNPIANRVVLAAASASINSRESIHIGGDLFISGNVNSNENSIFAASEFTGSIAGIGNVSSYSSSVNSRLVVVEAVSASAAGALNNVSGAFATTLGNLNTNFATDAELSAVSSAVATTISNLGNTYATDSELSAVSSAVAVRDAAQDVLISSLQSNIVSASVFNTFSTSVDSRITTEKGRVDAILLAADADKDSFAEIVTLINSVDTTNDTVFGGFVTSSNATNNAQNARLNSLESATGSYEIKGTGIVSGSSQITISSTTGYSTFSASIASTISNLGSTYATDAELSAVSSAVATTISNLDNTYATDASVTSVSGAFATTISNLGNTYATDSELSNVSGAFATRAANIDSTISALSSSVDSRLDAVELVSASAAGALNSVSGAFSTTISNLGNTYATDAELSAVSAAIAVRDAGQDTTISTLSSSVNSRLVVVEAVSASASSAYAKLNSTNTFNGNQTISGSLVVTQDLVIGGSASIQHVTSSQLNISTNLVTVNTINPTVRFGGLAIIDSGSSPSVSGSFLYDAVQDEFIFVHRGDGTNITSSVFLLGPETYNNLGNETWIGANKVIKSRGNEHTAESNITDNGTLITLGSNTSVTGTLVATGTTLVSASAQIDHNSTTNYSANRHIDHTAVSITAGSGLTGGGDISATRTISVATGGVTNDMLAGSIANAKLTNSSITIAGVSTALGGSITAATILGGTGVISGSAQLPAGVISGSSQVQAASITGDIALGTQTSGNYVASLVAGTNITLSNNSGEGATPTIGLTNNAITIAGTSTSLGGSITAATILGGTGVVSGSAQIDVASTTGDIALGTRTSGNYVATITAGTGVSSTGATTGEGIAHTISIGQAVATSSNVQFNSLGIGMAASATAGRIDATNDIVAFSSSDIRFKENIKPIENAIDKIRKISGNTYDWKEENKIEHGYEGNDVGVIAQEIEAVLPQLVQTRESGYKAVKYDKLVALLIEGIKEQQLQIEQLRIDLDNCRNNKGL